MGVVYQAFDRKHGRNVALKTLMNESDEATLELFRNELVVLSQNSHPNIVDVYDSGEMDEEGRRKPFFVMPLLRGQTLQELIENSSQALTVERVADIIIQTCKGLQSAHESGLIHRDLKPSNIFVLEDFSVKIIDFGVCHLVDRNNTMGLKGTLHYMAPEQIARKPLTQSADIFALGVVGWESLTGRRPFDGPSERDVIEAILRHSPPLVSELNATASQLVSLVIHKAMAKEPLHRFASALEMAECMQKALRNEPIEYFNPDRIQPRLMRARKAAAAGDHEFAQEILSELEAEGFCSPGITSLRQIIEDESRQRTVRHLLESARRRVQEHEYQLAMQKLKEVDDLDPGNSEAAAIKGQIERPSETPVERPTTVATAAVKTAALETKNAQVPKVAAGPITATARRETKPAPSPDLNPWLARLDSILQRRLKKRWRNRLRNLPWREVLMPVGAVLGLLLLVAGIRYIFFGNRVELRTDPADAVIEVEGKLQTGKPRLRPGTYNIVARSAGYQPFIKSLTFESGAPPQLTLKLVPLPSQLEVLTDLEGASVSLNGERVGEVAAGRYSLGNLPVGSHAVSVAREGAGQVASRFKIDAGRPPVVIAGPFLYGLHAIAVGTYRGAGRVFAPSADFKVKLNGKDVSGSTIAGSIEIPVLPKGQHEFAFVAGLNEHKLNLNIGEAPALFLIIWEGKRVGFGDQKPKSDAIPPTLPSPKPVAPKPATTMSMVPQAKPNQDFSRLVAQVQLTPALSAAETEPPPAVELAIRPNFIRIGDQLPGGVVVSWSTARARHVTIEPHEKFDQALLGNCRLYPAESLTIRLTADGAGGTVTQEAKVQVDDRFYKMPASFASRRCEPLPR